MLNIFISLLSVHIIYSTSKFHTLYTPNERLSIVALKKPLTDPF